MLLLELLLELTGELGADLRGILPNAKRDEHHDGVLRRLSTDALDLTGGAVIFLFSADVFSIYGATAGARCWRTRFQKLAKETAAPS